jgi:hypothetical protein
MEFADATKFHRKSGGAKWRDLLFFSEVNSPHTPSKAKFFLESVVTVL